MCDRYSFTLSKEKTIRRYGIKVKQALSAKYNIAPGMEAGVISQELPGELCFVPWGIEIPKATDRNAFKQVYTISSSAIQSQAYLQELLKHNRCIIPADGFYLWKKVSRKGKVPYRVVMKWNLPFAMAGLYITNQDNRDVQGIAILTVEANSLLKSVSKLMPAILSLEHEKTWLQPQLTYQEVIPMLQPYPQDTMKLFPVSAQLLITNTNSDQLTKPTQPTDQFGNYILFEDI